MSEARDAALEELLLAARADFARGLLAKAAELAAFVSSGAWNSARLAAHKLRGSAATYGFAGLGAAAGRLEDLLLDAAGSPDPTARLAMDEILRDVSASAESARGEAS